MGYFYDANGTKVSVTRDIDRHRSKEADLTNRIIALENMVNPGFDTFVYLQTYRELLAKLLASKAEAVNKLGRKRTSLRRRTR